MVLPGRQLVKRRDVAFADGTPALTCPCLLAWSLFFSKGHQLTKDMEGVPEGSPKGESGIPVGLLEGVFLTNGVTE